MAVTQARRKLGVKKFSIDVEGCRADEILRGASGVSHRVQGEDFLDAGGRPDGFGLPKNCYVPSKGVEE